MTTKKKNPPTMQHTRELTEEFDVFVKRPQADPSAWIEPLLLVLLLIGLVVNISLTHQALVAVGNLSATPAQRGSLPCEAIPVRFVRDDPMCAEKLLRAMNVTNVRIVENASQLPGVDAEVMAQTQRYMGINGSRRSAQD